MNELYEEIENKVFGKFKGGVLIEGMTDQEKLRAFHHLLGRQFTDINSIPTVANAWLDSIKYAKK